jgi:hypothetical protein
MIVTLPHIGPQASHKHTKKHSSTLMYWHFCVCTPPKSPISRQSTNLHHVPCCCNIDAGTALRPGSHNGNGYRRRRLLHPEVSHKPFWRSTNSKEERNCRCHSVGYESSSENMNKNQDLGSTWVRPISQIHPRKKPRPRGRWKPKAVSPVKLQLCFVGSLCRASCATARC